MPGLRARAARKRARGRPLGGGPLRATTQPDQKKGRKLPQTLLDLGVGRTGPHSKCEEGRKSIHAISFAHCTSSMCGLVLEECRLPALRNFRKAFLTANEAAFTEMDAMMKASARGVPVVDRAPQTNGADALDWIKEWWLMAAAELQIAAATPEQYDEEGLARTGAARQEWYDEPAHMDGARSVFHLSLTLYGTRLIRFEQGEGRPEVIVRASPGSVYFGGLTGARHQVHHVAALAEHDPVAAALPLLKLEGPLLGDCSVTVQFRSALFARHRSACGEPRPASVFKAVENAVRAVMSQHQLRLPTLAECEDAYSIDS